MCTIHLTQTQTATAQEARSQDLLGAARAWCHTFLNEGLFIRLCEAISSQHLWPRGRPDRTMSPASALSRSPLDDTYMYSYSTNSTTSGRLCSSCMVARGANPQASAHEMLEPNGTYANSPFGLHHRRQGFPKVRCKAVRWTTPQDVPKLH